MPHVRTRIASDQHSTIIDFVRSLGESENSSAKAMAATAVIKIG
jgi:hypothetical protein